MRAEFLPPLLLAVALLLHPAPCAAKGVTVEQSLRANKQLAKQGQESLTRLTAKERELHGDLARVEDELDALRARITKHEAELKRLDKHIEGASAEHDKLTAAQQATYRDLGRLAAALWPLRLADAHARAGAARGWDEADRRFTWGATLYADAHRALRDIENRSTRISANLTRQQELRAQAEAALVAINADKDAMLSKRIDFVHHIREVRAERLNQEEAMEQVLATIEELQYRIKTTQAGKFQDLKGKMPWPVDGKRLSPGEVSDASVRGGGGRGGTGFATAEAAPVHAVFRGRVVHNDLLRGYGHVVIVSHGENWYSLYAFLAESNVAAGQEIDGGATLGRAGYYPAAKGSGLYFELRSGQKAINPVHWLTERR